MKYTSETLLVRPINEEAILQKVKKLLKEDNPNVSYEIGKSSALAADSNIVVDNECMYQIMEKRLTENGIDYIYETPVYKCTKTETGKMRSVFPDFYVSVSHDELLDSCLPAITLKEFMGSRYNYNPRITKNTSDFLKTVNE